MSKICENCTKTITKSIPGVECAKCEQIVHLNTKCTGLTGKQIAALKASPSLEWTCLQCQCDTTKRSSIIIPEEEEDYEGTIPQINTKQLLNNISKEVGKAIKNEMKELNESLQYHSAKLDEVVECIDVLKKTIKTLERKNIELTNKNTNLEIRMGAMEQRMHELEQEKLNNIIEISNLSTISQEEAVKVIENIAIKLNQSKDLIKNLKILQGRNDQPSKLLVELKDNYVQEKWLMAAKKTKITVGDINPIQGKNKNTVYINEAMTKLNKQILWNAKQELKMKQNYIYVETRILSGTRCTGFQDNRRVRTSSEPAALRPRRASRDPYFDAKPVSLDSFLYYFPPLMIDVIRAALIFMLTVLCCAML
ncbi:hypothetical protein ACJJTC_006426 [Scirpophaga incertulas]